MKRVLITGANSYIGTSLETYLKDFPGAYQVDTLDMVGDRWRTADFSGYDAVFHVAGIAHADNGKASQKTIDLYYRVNTDLAVETARKAKRAGVKQFIFMSSANVYGDSAPIGKSKHITKKTAPSPAGYYGDSKLQAEKGILPMQDKNFNVVVLRPPMIYGEGCKGNYPTLSKMARKLPFFPKVRNKRSMLYIWHLTEFVRLMIENQEKGIFHPQNSTYSNTAQLVELIAGAHGKKTRLVRGFTGILRALAHVTSKINKAFGSLTYDMTLSEYSQEYRKYTLEETITRTEAQQ